MDRRYAPGPVAVRRSDVPPPRRPEPGVRADALTPDEKRAVWAWMRTNDPEFAAFCRAPEVKALIERYRGAASIFFPKAVIDAALGYTHKSQITA